RAALRRVELGGEALCGDRFGADVAVRVAARGEDEHRPAAGRVELRVLDRDVVPREPAEDDEQLARARIEPGLLELLEASPGLGSHPSRLRSSRSSGGTWGTETSHDATPSRRCISC